MINIYKLVLILCMWQLVCTKIEIGEEKIIVTPDIPGKELLPRVVIMLWKSSLGKYAYDCNMSSDMHFINEILENKTYVVKKVGISEFVDLAEDCNFLKKIKKRQIYYGMNSNRNYGQYIPGNPYRTNENVRPQNGTVTGHIDITGTASHGLNFNYKTHSSWPITQSRNITRQNTQSKNIPGQNTQSRNLSKQNTQSRNPPRQDLQSRNISSQNAHSRNISSHYLPQRNFSRPNKTEVSLRNSTDTSQGRRNILVPAPSRIETEDDADDDIEGYNGWDIIFPGTRWCGAGSRAENREDLGRYSDTDNCCRAHDWCNDTMAPGETKYNLTNHSKFTKLNCRCDEAFYDCLLKVNSMISNKIGHVYFNILRRSCFRYDYPLTDNCQTFRSPLKITCKEFAKNTEERKIYRWISARTYRRLPIPGPFNIDLPFI